MPQEDIVELEAGKYAFLADTIEAPQILACLNKHGISIIRSADALFDSTGKSFMMDFIVEAKKDDISFALEARVNNIRSRPKGYVFKL